MGDVILEVMGKKTITMSHEEILAELSCKAMNVNVVIQPQGFVPAQTAADPGSLYEPVNTYEVPVTSNLDYAEDAGAGGQLDVYGMEEDAFAPPPAGPPFAERYLVGAMSRADAESLLVDAGARVGDFLVRESRGAHVLTVVLESGGKCVHHQVAEDAGAGQFTVNQKHTIAAGSMEELVKQWLGDPAGAKAVLRCTVVEHPFAEPDQAVDMDM